MVDAVYYTQVKILKFMLHKLATRKKLLALLTASLKHL